MMRSALEALSLVVRYGVQDSDIAIDLFEKLKCLDRADRVE